MGRAPKTGRDVEPERGYKGAKAVRDLHEWLTGLFDRADDSDRGRA